MSRLVCRVAVFAIPILIAQNVGAGERAGPALTGRWGFDLAGADFRNNPGDDFFRHANGAWYDRALIPADRSSIGVDTVLNITAEARIREILERGEEGVGPSARMDAAKIGAFYAAFMNEAHVEALDAEPIAPLLQMIRVAASREELAELMGDGRRSFFNSIFALGIGPDDKAPDRYAVSIGQGGLGLNRDYYVTPPEKWREYSALEVRPDDLFGDVQGVRKFDWLRQLNRLNSPVDRDDWYMSPQTVNASYNASLNEMVFPAGILQPPFFDPAADPAVNYGGIGAVIGHEMIHGYDDEGRKYDGAGVLSTWWTHADADQFAARAAILGRQFDSYEPFPGLHIKGDLTMGENIADLGGALVALDAYHDSLRDKPAPVIDGLDGDQRFFLSYAQTWRHKSTDDSIRQQIVSNAHAPVKYRVNGVVRNMDAWYQSFNVKPSDSLFLLPQNRVRIW